MNDSADDPDLKEAVTELGNALDAALLGASSSEVQRIIDAIGNLIDVRIAIFAELAADRFAKRAE